MSHSNNHHHHYHRLYHDYSDVPKLVLADMRGGSMKRYIYEGDIKNSGKIGKFMGEFFDGKLKVNLSNR